MIYSKSSEQYDRCAQKNRFYHQFNAIVYSRGNNWKGGSTSDMGDAVENRLEAIDMREFYRWIPHSISRETDLDFFKQAFLRSRGVGG